MIRTLYVDDDPTLLDLAKEFLEGENDDLSVTTCTSAKDVLTLLRTNEYDVIISDYQMPIMSGIDLLKELRSHGVDIPFILFTGRGREEIAVDALNNGADFYLNKGGNPRVQFTELMNLVRHMVMKRQAIEALKHNAERFRAMIENSLDLIVILNPEGMIRYASPSVRKVLSIQVENLIGQSLESLVHVDDHPRCRALLATNGPIAQEIIEVRLKRGDAGYTLVEGSFSRAKDGEGRTSIIFNARDITKRHRAEELLRESEERYHAIFESSPAGMILLDEGVVDCNSMALELLGLDRQSLIGRTIKELSALEDAHKAEHLVVQHRSNKDDSTSFQWNVHRKDGHVKLNALLKKVTVHGLPRMLLILSEMEEKAAEVKEERAEQRMSIADETCRTILTTTNDAVILIDKEGIVTFHSPRASKMFGHGPELTGVRMLDLVDFKEQDALAHDIDSLRQGLPVTSRRFKFLARDGSPIYAEMSGRHIPETGHLVCLFRDVTGNVLAEEQVLTANKHLAEAGEMLRQDVGKHVTALIGQLQIMQFHFREPNAREEMERAIAQAQKVMSALDNAKSYSLMTGQTHQWALLPDMMAAVKAHFASNETALKVDVGPYEVLADPLICSAFEKMMRHMMTRGADVKNIWVRTAEEGGALWVIFEDDGAGYSQADLNRMMKEERLDHPLTFATEVAKDSMAGLEGKAGPDGLHFRWSFRTGRWRKL